MTSRPSAPRTAQTGTLARTRIAPDARSVSSIHEGCARGRVLRPVVGCALVRVAMFALFERLLKPTAIAETAEPPAGLVAFYWHFARQAKLLFAALFVAGFCVALLDTMIPVFIGRVVTLVTAAKPEDAVRRHWPMLLGMALVLLVLRPARAHGAEPARQPGDRRQRVEPDPLAEPLARGAAVLGVLPERFRRPHRQPRDADRAGDPRDHRRADHRRLVHPGLRHQRAAAARHRRPVARAADRAVVRRLSGAAARCSCRACATAPRRCRRRARC